jgi:hypothetical protein
VIKSQNAFPISLTSQKLIFFFNCNFGVLAEIPREAFQLRHPIEEFSFPADLDLVINEFGASNLVDEDEIAAYDTSSKNQRPLNQTTQQSQHSHSQQQQQFKLDFNANSLLSAEIGPAAAFKYTDIVASMLKAFAQDGDVQTACSILLVLGDRAKTTIDSNIQEIWFQSYIGSQPILLFLFVALIAVVFFFRDRRTAEPISAVECD